jgi:hypothetical protein
MISVYDVFFYGILAVVLIPVAVLAVGLGWWLRIHRGFVHVGRRMGPGGGTPQHPSFSGPGWSR